jgi:Recombination endonuclease VII
VKAKVLDLAGATFGRWRVLRRVRKTGSDGALYECQCECGTRRVVEADSLRRGTSQSCGDCGATKKRFCFAGHDTSILGRSEAGCCRACIRDKRLRTLYGITLEEYAELWVFQGGKCAICGTPLQAPNEIGKPGFGKGVRVEVDHDHAKGLKPRQAVRGLLCGGRWKGCNRKIGGGLDNVGWLRQVMNYLEQPPAQAFIRQRTESEKK